MKIPQPIVIDFETFRIENRPDYPPEPVGVAVRDDEFDGSLYSSWGHPDGNNSTLEDARKALAHVWISDRPLLFHNAKFDLAVACEKLGLPMPSWDRVYDTMFLAFLADPHSKSNGLKDLAEDLLGWAPEERDEIAEYLWENRHELHEKYPDQPRITKETGKPQANKRSTGEWLAYCPADIVAPYAIGDVDRTLALFNHLYPLIVENGMLEAYNRERQVLPIFMENERLGIRVDVEGLERDIAKYHACRETVDAWLRERLGDPDLNIDSDRDFAEALGNAGIIDDDQWVMTKTGQRSVSKKNLTPDMYNDKEVANAFGYRNRLGTCLKMFMEPWLAQAKRTGGTVHTNWNQTRGGDGGTRTGRPSTSNPNFLNLSKSFEGRTDGYEHPEHLKIDPLPLVRSYVLPDEGHILIRRDFSGQELRVFAHFECGDLCKSYNETPTLDVHAKVGDEMRRLAGKEFERTRVKVINFQSLYGGGVPALCRELRISQSEAKELKAFHDKALPGRKILNEEITKTIRSGGFIRTWGGRVYYAETPRYVNGRWMDFIYKLLNYAVQGSAADLTKQAIIDWYNDHRRDPRCRLVVTVYDEIVASCPVDVWKDQMNLLREAMNKRRLDVPMLSDGEYGDNWGVMEDYVD